MLINLKLLRKLDVCSEGIDDFEDYFGNQSVSVDDLINKSLELELDHVSWLIAKFSKHIVELNWSELSSGDWRLLLCKQPQFSEYCNWSKLSGGDWCLLLCFCPQFSEHCDWSLLNGVDWQWLLIKQPQFEKYRPTS